MNRDVHLIYESWKEVFSGQQVDRWKELSHEQRLLVQAYVDKVRNDFNVPSARQDIRVAGVYNSPTNPEHLKFVHIHVPERPVHVVELDTKHNEIYEPHAHPHGNREQVKLDVDEEMPYPVFAKLAKHANSKVSHVAGTEEDKDTEDEPDKVVKEQGPLAALSNAAAAPYRPGVAAAQGAMQGVAPYAAGAVAGVKQLGQNLAGAVTGNAAAPQSPMAASKQAFSQQQINNAVQSVMKAFGMPADPMYVPMITKQIQDIANRLQGVEQRWNQNQQQQNQFNVDQALQSTSQQITPQMARPPRAEPNWEPGFSKVKPGFVTGGQVPASQTYQMGMRGMNPSSTNSLY